MKAFVYSIYEKFDTEIYKEKSKSLLPLGHSIIMIYDCTHLLKCCHDEKSYKSFGTYKELEQFLNKNKETMDMHSYMLLRKKISFIKDKLI